MCAPRKTVGAVKLAYYKSTGTWTGASWRHEKGSHPYGQDPVYCEGDSPLTCDICAQAEDDAMTAEAQAGHAVQMAVEGFWDDAEEAAEKAYRLENEWGDAPTWRPFLTAVREARAIAESQEET